MWKSVLNRPFVLALAMVLIILTLMGAGDVVGQGLVKGKVGDAHIFYLKDSLVYYQGEGPVHESVGTVPAGDYHIVFTGMIHWEDPRNLSIPRSLDVGLDLDAYDASTGVILDWNSNIYVRYVHTYESDALAPQGGRHDVFVSEQSVVTIPQGANLVLNRFRQEHLGSEVDQVVLQNARFVLTRVNRTSSN